MNFGDFTPKLSWFVGFVVDVAAPKKSLVGTVVAGTLTGIPISDFLLAHRPLDMSLSENVLQSTTVTRAKLVESVEDKDVQTKRTGVPGTAILTALKLGKL